MEIKNVRAKDVEITIVFDASEIDMLLDVLANATVDTKTEAITKAYKYVKGVFCRDLEQLMTTIKEKTDGT